MRKETTTSLNEQTVEEQKAAAAAINAGGNGVSLAEVQEPEQDPEEQDTVVYETDEQEEPQPRTRVRRTRSRRTPVQPRTPAASSAERKVTDKVIGNSVRFRFYKIDKMGKESLLGDYSSNELEKAGHDKELFIQTYLVPTYGEGEFAVKSFNSKGVETGTTRCAVLSPASHRPTALPAVAGSAFEQNLISQQQIQLAKLQEEQRAAEREAKNQAQQQLLQLQRQIAQMQEKGGDGNGSSMMLMMMQMQMQMQQQQAEAQRRADLQREQLQLQAQIAAASAPPPPLPPPPKEGMDVKDMIQTMLMMREAFSQPKDDTKERYLQDRIRDLEKGQERPRGFKDIFEEMEVFEAFASKHYKQEDSTVATVLGSFLENFADNMHALRGVLSVAPAPVPAQLPPSQEETDALPSGFVEQIAQLDSVESDEDRIGVVLNSFKLLATSGSPKYKRIVARMWTLIQKNDKATLGKIIKEFLNECAERDMITQVSADATFKTFDRRFEAVVAVATGKPIPVQKEEEEDGKS